MKKEIDIVVAALDFDATMEQVAARARSLADCVDARLLVVHVVDESAVINFANEESLAEAVVGDYQDKALDAELAVRERLERRLAPLGIAGSAIEVLVGKPARMLVQRCRGLAGAVLVLGQPMVLVGSVVGYVTHHAACDIHIVRAVSEAGVAG